MSSPIDLDKNLDPVLQYAPRWARENAARPEEAWDAPPVVERIQIQEPVMDQRGAFSGDRAAKELFRQLALHPQRVPEPVVDESRSLRPLLLRIGAIMAVAAGIAGLVVVLPGAKKDSVHTSQSGDSSVGPQYASHTNSAGSQYSSHPARLTPVEATENRASPPPADPIVVASASNTDVPVSPPPPAQQVHPVVAEAHAAGAYLARSDGSALSPAPAVAPAPMPTSSPAPVQSSAPAPVQSSAPAPAAPQKQNDRAQAPANEPAGATREVARTLDRKEIATLLDQAENLVHTGDLSGARVLLQRAAEAGNADAALELAGTFDPRVLRELGAIGIAPDPERARKWYERAAALGSDAAAKKLAGLQQANR